jgi:hypothetical protein
MASKRDILSKLSLDDLLELEKEISEVGEENLDQSEREKYRIIKGIIEKIEKGGVVQEVVRDAVFDIVKESYKDAIVFSSDANRDDPFDDSGEEIVKKKRNELYDVLDNIDQHVKGKNIKEVTAFFTSLLDIQGQLCMQKTEGVITVRTRLFNFFSLPDQEDIRPELRQEISLIFTPEEINAMRMRLPDLRDDDPMRPFFTMVLDQAYDVLQYNEMTGNLLLEMTNYFLIQLVNNGHGEHPKVGEFRERHDRCRISLKKALEDLRQVERVINKHLADRPILLELPKCLRALIQIKIGILDKNHTQTILQKIYNTMGDYARSRAAVAFDFNRLPSYQHGVRLRQSVILNLQKDVLRFTGEQMEKEFQAVKEELEAMMAAIEAQSEHLDPNSPEYEALLKQKDKLQTKMENQRRKLDVIHSQQSLVEVQHTMIGEAIQRYQKNEAMYQKLEDDLKNRPKEKIEQRSSAPTQKRKPIRMVMARKARGN